MKPNLEDLMRHLLNMIGDAARAGYWVVRLVLIIAREAE